MMSARTYGERRESVAVVCIIHVPFVVPKMKWGLLAAPPLGPRPFVLANAVTILFGPVLFYFLHSRLVET
jgi:hypothetical protein